MIKKIILLIIIGVIGYFVYNEYIKSDFDKAVDATEEVIEETADDIEDAVKDM